MSVASLLSSHHPTAFSFEILPPLRGKGMDSVFKDIDRLMPFNPAYINITTHRTEITYRETADGTFTRTASRRRPGSTAIAAVIKGRYGTPTVPHIICADTSRMEIENELIDLSYLGITDLLVLRGDRARGENRFVAARDGHEHAIELCRQVNDFNCGMTIYGEQGVAPSEPFSYGVAGYPEKHEEAMNLETDMTYLKAKVAEGAEYIVTQMFFDNTKYFAFVNRCRAEGITVPIVPGVKPLTTLAQKAMLPKTFHIDFPQELASELDRCRDNDDVKMLGVEWGTAQCRELKEAGVPSIHFYSMNAAASVEKIALSVY